MEFDINLILVPVTLVLLVAYLADKFVLKQHKVVAEYQRLTGAAQSNLVQAEKAFRETLTRCGHSEAPDEFVVTEHTPEILRTAHTHYQEAKRSLIHAQGGVEVKPPKEFFLVRWAYEYLLILLVLVVVRAFVIEPFNIPSSSMVPSLYTGDFIVVNKYAYGLRLPLTHTKIMNTGSPAHGDVAVFRYPENEKQYYIKRVIGLPGDTVGFNQGVLSINGKVVDTKPTNYRMDETLNAKLMPQIIQNQRISDEEREQFGKQEEVHARYYREVLGSHSYTVRYLGDLNSAVDAPFLAQQSPQVITSKGTTWQLKVPDGQYFVMGDNRDRSSDSRFWGFVAEHQLAGRATYIWMHKEPGLHLPTFARTGKID